MKLKSVGLRNFTVFRDSLFELAPGLNVFIGENGTGKSHLLKVIYALSEAVRRSHTGEPLVWGRRLGLNGLVHDLLQGVFQPESLASFSTNPQEVTSISLVWSDGRGEKVELDVELHPRADGLIAEVRGPVAKLDRAIFVPPREVLSIFPGFIAAWQKRESGFDSTYFDLCTALALRPLRDGGPRELIEPLEREIQGRVVLKSDQFYVVSNGTSREAAMVGDGDRKLAMIAHLLMNGSLAGGSCLLWDEPEANLNPKRANLASGMMVALAHHGMQILAATHDYALTSEIALQVDTDETAAGGVAFFSLRRDAGASSILVERGDRLAELSHNAMLDALAGLHDREMLANDVKDVRAIAQGED